MTLVGGTNQSWVDLSIHPQCNGSEDCGLARACINGLCLACSRNLDCAAGERCALDHCVPAEQVECQSYSDCAKGELCVLSGLSPDPRNNAQMTARCSAGQDDRAQPPAEEMRTRDQHGLGAGPTRPPLADEQALLTATKRDWLGE